MGNVVQLSDIDRYFNHASLARTAPSLARTVLKPSVLQQRGTRRQRQLVVTDGGWSMVVDGGWSKKKFSISPKILTLVLHVLCLERFFSFSSTSAAGFQALCADFCDGWWWWWMVDGRGGWSKKKINFAETSHTDSSK